MNLHVSANCSIILLRAPWASEVRASASSRKITLNEVPGMGAVRANCLTLVRIDSNFLSSLAFISRRLFLNPSPNTSLVSARAAVVFPVPGGPANIRCGNVLDSE